jgi:hypothetical protein
MGAAAESAFVLRVFLSLIFFYVSSYVTNARGPCSDRQTQKTENFSSQAREKFRASSPNRRFHGWHCSLMLCLCARKTLASAATITKLIYCTDWTPLTPSLCNLTALDCATEITLSIAPLARFMPRLATLAVSDHLFRTPSLAPHA